MTRESITPPFPFNEGNVIERVNSMTKRKTVKEVVSDFQSVHGFVYDYSLIKDYKSNKEPLPILCKKHGVFMQSANSHLRGCGCPKCADERTGERCRMTLQLFLEKANSVHNKKYGYELIDDNTYKGYKYKVPITCPIHGTFYQTPKEHVKGKGCPKCGKESMARKQRFDRNELVELFNKQFGGIYDYSLFKKEDYKHRNDKIKVICKKHGVFEVSVSNHLYRHSGCPRCKRSFGEEKISRYLTENHIEFVEQYRIGNEDLFCKNSILIVDFYLPKHNTIIEFNGIQHYEENPFFNTRNLSEQKERDDAVRIYCKNHGIKLIVIPYTDINKIDKILKKQQIWTKK